MYRFLVVAIVLAVAGLELTFPTKETTARFRSLLPEMQLTAALSPQTAIASEASTPQDPAELWELRRVKHANPPKFPHPKRFHSGF